jgi:hypothetical protein
MNIRKPLIPVSIFLLMLLAFSACKKDLGNYSYTDANSVTITTDMANVDPQVVVTNDSIVVRQNDSLKVDILVAQTLENNDLSYQWMVTQRDASFNNPPLYIVGTSKQLRTKITLPPNLYRLVVKVTDNKTGVSFYKFYSLNVDTSPWGGEGWLVLQEQAAQGGCDIAMITSRDGVVRGTVYPNVYEAANSHKLPMGTYKMAVLNYLNSLRIQKVSFFYPNGGVQVRSVDYLDSSNHAGWFFLTPSVVNIQANAVFPATGQFEYLINNGQLHAQAVNATSIKSPIKLSPPFLGSWPELSPHMILGNADGVYTLFDKGNRCFLTVWNNGGNLTLVPTAKPDIKNSHYNAYSGAGGAVNLAATGKGFDMNNIGRDLVYTENVSPMSGTITYDCIFRNTAGDSSFLYQIPGAFSGPSGGYVNNFTSGRFFLSESKVPGINTASIFAMPTFLPVSGTTFGVFYYVHGTNKNSIYVCAPSYTGTMPATTTSSLGYSFPAGTIIKTMKVFKSGYTTAPTTESKVLVVATDESANGNGHNVYFFNLTATGGINSTPAQVYTGFDKIVDVTFKKGLGL